MPLQISEKVMALAAQAQAGLRDQFDRIDSIAEENTRKVLAAFQKHRVAEAYFAGTTGYGYDDLGRDKLDEIFAELFGTEDALVRVQFVNGTHAISCALFGALKPGDILVSAVGAPYDTMLGVIGVVDKGPGSLKSYGIEYRQVDLLDDAPDPEGLARAVRDPRVKAVLIQRSKGYSTRSSLSVAEIGALCQVVRANNPEAAILVDNCYGEFVETLEPTQAGADLVFLPIYYQPASLILSQADAMGYTPTFFGVDGMDGILTMDGFDASLAEGVMLLTPFNADATDEATVNFVTKYQELYGETPNQFAADAYDCVYAYKMALEAAGCTPDMSNEELCDALIATFPTITLTGLTGDGAGITWDASGEVSKSPKGMVIENGAYVGMD